MGRASAWGLLLVVGMCGGVVTDPRWLGTLKPSLPSPGSLFGGGLLATSRLGSSGSRIVVGQPELNSGRGAVSIFTELAVGNWQLQLKIAPTTGSSLPITLNAGANFGAAICESYIWSPGSLTDRLMIVGAPGDSSSGATTGAVYLVQLDSNYSDVSQSSRLNAAPGELFDPGDKLGASCAVTLDVNTAPVILVGAPGRDNDKGAFFAWRMEQSSFVILQSTNFGTMLGGLATGDMCGASIMGLTVSDPHPTSPKFVVGCPGYSNGAGKIFILRLNANLQGMQGYSILFPSSMGLGTLTGVNFGAALALAGDADSNGYDNELVVSAPSYGGNRGAVITAQIRWNANILGYDSAETHLLVHGTKNLNISANAKFGSALAHGTGANFGQKRLFVGAPAVNEVHAIEIWSPKYCLAPEFYNTSATLPQCYRCPRGYFCPINYMTIPSTCIAGTFCDEGTITPLMCPAEHYCPERAQAPVECLSTVFCPPGSGAPTTCPADNTSSTFEITSINLRAHASDLDETEYDVVGSCLQLTGPKAGPVMITVPGRPAYIAYTDPGGQWVRVRVKRGLGRRSFSFSNNGQAATRLVSHPLLEFPLPVVSRTIRSGGLISLSSEGFVNSTMDPQSAVQRIEIGGVTCLGLAPSIGGWTCSDSIVSQTDRPYGVVVHLDGGVNLTAPSLVPSQWYRPVITSVSPAFLFFDDAALDGNLTFVIRGVGLGARASDVTDVSIGSQPCTTTEWFNASMILCNVSRLLDKRVGVRVVGLRSVGVWSGQGMTDTPAALTVLPPRRILGVLVPGGIPSVGGVNITLVGTSLVEPSEHPITSVLVGGKPCSWSGVIGGRLLCTVPPGTGSFLSVSALTSTSLYSTNAAGVVSYQKPILRSISPSYVVSNAAKRFRFVLIGANFGPGRTFISQFTVGSQPCPAIVYVNDSVVECHNVTGAWSGEDVSLTVDGQTSVARMLSILPKPQVTRVTPSVVATLGATPVEIEGVGFGDSQTAVTSVRVGDNDCLSFTLTSPTTITCVVPPGIGSGLSVLVQTSENGATPVNSLFGYAAPLVTSVTNIRTGAAYAMAGETNVSLLVEVTNVGPSLSLVSDFRVVESGSTARCQMLVVVARVANEIQMLRCDGLSFAAFGESGGLARVQFSVSHQSAETADTSILTLVGRPVVQLIAPQVVSTSITGNATHGGVSVIGAGFGELESDVLRVLVDEVPCPLVRRVSSTELSVTVPAGVGPRRVVRVVTVGGWSSAVSDRSTLRSSEPTITRVDPSYLLRAVEPRVLVEGTDFGNSASDVRRVTVGHVPCESVTFVSSSRLVCHNLNASRHMSDSIVRVDVGGTVGTSNDRIMEVLPVPSVTSIVPEFASPQTNVTIAGAGFGYQQSDVLLVTVNGQPCDQVVVRNPNTLSCRVPPPTGEVQERAAIDPRALLNQPVVITVRGDRQSPPVHLHYRGGGSLPTNIPTHVLGWREASSAQRIYLRWTFPMGASLPWFSVSLIEDGVPRVIDFLPNDTVASAVNDTSLYRTEFLSLSSHPISLRMSVRNDIGYGNWSKTIIVFPGCASHEYLMSYRPLAGQLCNECPRGAHCGGGRASNVTALSGHWRIPWSSAGLGFQECPVATSCLGYSAAQSRNYSVSNLEGIEQLLPQPPSLSDVVSPEALESCASGYQGVLCSACEEGFTRWGRYECRKCADRVLVGLAAAGVSVIVLFMVGHLTLNAVRSSLQDSVKMDVAAIKIGFSFLQTVSIASSFELRWPDSVRGLFGVMESVTSVTSDVLSLDCMLLGQQESLSSFFPNGSVFLARTSIMLSVPFLLVFVVALFWFCVAPLCGKCIDQFADERAMRSLSVEESAVQQTITPSGRRRALSTPIRALAHKSATKKLRSVILGEHTQDIKLTVWDRLTLMVVVMLFMVHMSVTKASLQLLTCQRLSQLGPPATLDGVTPLEPSVSGSCPVALAASRLAGDLELCCNDPAVQTFTLGLGIPSVLVYALGIPLSSVVLLGRNRHRLDEKHVKATLGFLYSGYRHSVFYWEAVVMVRKALVAGIAVFLAPAGAAIQTYAALLLVFGLTVLQAVSRPFRFEILNRLELCSLVSAFVTFACGLFLTDPNSSDAIRVSATLVIFVLNLAVIVSVLVIVLRTSAIARRLAKCFRCCGTATVTTKPNILLPNPTLLALANAAEQRIL
jgi:hypothetical protein